MHKRRFKVVNEQESFGPLQAKVTNIQKRVPNDIHSRKRNPNKEPLGKHYKKRMILSIKPDLKPESTMLFDSENVRLNYRAAANIGNNGNYLQFNDMSYFPRTTNSSANRIDTGYGLTDIDEQEIPPEGTSTPVPSLLYTSAPENSGLIQSGEQDMYQHIGINYSPNRNLFPHDHHLCQNANSPLLDKYYKNKLNGLYQRELFNASKLENINYVVCEKRETGQPIITFPSTSRTNIQREPIGYQYQSDNKMGQFIENDGNDTKSYASSGGNATYQNSKSS